MAQGYRCIARVVKAHGIHGEVVAVAAHGLPAVLTPGLNVAVVPPQLKSERWHTVAGVETTEAGQLVSFADISETNAAHELVGKYLIARVSDVPDLEAADELEQLCGLEVVDERLGLLGVVTEILEGPVQDILVVAGERGETMIPAVDELVWYADDEKSLESSIPVGLAPWDVGEDA